MARPGERGGSDSRVRRRGGAQSHRPRRGALPTGARVQPGPPVRQGPGRIGIGAGSGAHLPARAEALAGIERRGKHWNSGRSGNEKEIGRNGTLMSTSVTPQLEPEVLKARIERFRQVQSEIVTQVRRVIVGQEEVLEQIMIGLFVGGHCLITGLPGTAKTLLVRTIAQTLGLVYKRIQFTPDLMPSDITGTDIIEEDPPNGRRTWTFIRGPIFANILLADEINRTPPKTQSALLEAMQELSCTVRAMGNRLAPPFFVLATQNPIELEGTYPLPEAQLDRFLFNVLLDYLSAA